MHKFHGSAQPARSMTEVLGVLVRQNQPYEALEQGIGFGRWWHAPGAAEIALSGTAARILQVAPGLQPSLDAAFWAVVQDDLGPLVECFAPSARSRWEHEFRVVVPGEGVRWLCLRQLPGVAGAAQVVAGVVQDITAAKLAAMRERLGFAMTQYLGGAQSLEETLYKVLALICQDLGWEWGAYWAVQGPGSDGAAASLLCQVLWEGAPELTRDFSALVRTLRVPSGHGLVGRVQAFGEPLWEGDAASHLPRSQGRALRSCGLRSGYAFPVAYSGADGRQHTVGVMEFYSCLDRQANAQLPRLSHTIGDLVAQMMQRLEHQAEVLRLTQVDGLTGLANRSHFHACLAQACARAQARQERFALAFIDLDRFKPVNDAYGHDAGNVVLQAFAHRLAALAPEGAVLARLGGDEFALLLPPQAVEQAAALMDAVLRAANTPFAYADVELTLSASVGLAVYPQGGQNAQALLQSADAAMYRVKNSGRNGCELSLAAGAEVLAQRQMRIAHRLALESDLHHALAAGQGLHLAYQPIIDARNGTMVSVEALLRWQRSDGSWVAPDEFIPIAEQSNLIVRLGRWVLEHACRDLARLRHAARPQLGMHINLAAPEFTSADLLPELQSHLQRWGLPARALSLELTEDMVMQRPEQVIRVMHSLREAGFGISLDDFGKGHSSLSLLKNLPLSSLKIDRSFVREMVAQDKDRAIVRAIVELGQVLGLSVIAEGVETLAQFAALRSLGCERVQGYLYGRPMPLETLLQSEGEAP
ncbi:MAG: putative bifunctional diguanylate cyclase/phosphodiesterase [Rhodoferax sp.]